MDMTFVLAALLVCMLVASAAEHFRAKNTERTSTVPQQLSIQNTHTTPSLQVRFRRASGKSGILKQSLKQSLKRSI